MDKERATESQQDLGKPRSVAHLNEGPRRHVRQVRDEVVGLQEKPANERLRDAIAKMSPEEKENYGKILGELAAFYQGPGGP